MQILGLSSTVRRANEVQRDTSHNAYRHFLTRLNHQQRYFLETGKGEIPYISTGYELDYVDKDNLAKNVTNRFVAFTGDAKQYLENCFYWNNTYLLHAVRLNRIFSIDTFNWLCRSTEFKYVSDLVILSRMHLHQADQLKHLNMKHLNSLHVTIKDELTDTIARTILDDWQLSSTCMLTVHISRHSMSERTYCRFMDKFYWRFVRYPYRASWPTARADQELAF